MPGIHGHVLLYRQPFGNVIILYMIRINIHPADENAPPEHGSVFL